MWRRNMSASIQNSSRSPSSRHSARATSQLKHVCSVSVGVKAVKSCRPTSAAAQAASSSRSSGAGHQNDRSRSKTLRVRRASTR